MLEFLIAGLLLLIIHFGEPVYYFMYVKGNKLNISPVYSEPPKVSIIIPTYNEGDKIREKIKNVLDSYPNDYMEILVVDSSNDGTDEIVKTMGIPQIRIIKEEKRKGKIFAVKEGIRNAKNNLVIITDADAIWENPLINAVKFLGGEIGAVSCIKSANSETENAYRNFYNVIRLGESAIFATPIFHGEMTAFRKDIINDKDLPNVGADDSTIATLTAIKGFRAICVKDFLAKEIAPKGLDYVSWKMRRGSHLVRHFFRNLSKVLKSNNQYFKKIFVEEFYLHIINPWLLVLGILFLAIGNIEVFSILLILLLISLVSSKTREAIRAWIPNQFFLILAQLFATKGEVLAWKKEKK
ncbi:glycosyltransferase [Acidianus brierleyi]|uniref:Glycosyl transferase family 2 n=1 Tax=Acidianus brierleyi TaxID=41673 RepID=A0A2U9ID72_9CREN|nr:glycosyltransferase [Acidianus brierleyi]AWR93975.1 glycosyltransferase [Acidianus brierleyi]